MADSDSRLIRYRVVEELVELASPAEEQIRYIGNGLRIELLKGYLNWSVDMLAVLNKRGALTPEIVEATDAVTRALFDLDRELAEEYDTTGKITAFSDAALRDDPRWEHIRDLAGRALEAFRALGTPIPRLSDDDFNTPRESAP